jgi:D-amino-acid oxidase
VNSSAESVVVVGAGVSGLTTGICLAEAGRLVRVWAAEPPQLTTSVGGWSALGSVVPGADG